MNDQERIVALELKVKDLTQFAGIQTLALINALGILKSSNFNNNNEVVKKYLAELEENIKKTIDLFGGLKDG